MGSNLSYQLRTNRTDTCYQYNLILYISKNLCLNPEVICSELVGSWQRPLSLLCSTNCRVSAYNAIQSAGLICELLEAEMLCTSMNVQIICYKDDLFGSWIQLVRHISKNLRKIHSCSTFCHNCLSYAWKWLVDHKYIRNSITDIFIIYFFSWPDSQGMRACWISCLLVSSIQITGTIGSYGRWYNSTIFATNSASASGIHHSFTSHGLILFFPSLHIQWYPLYSPLPPIESIHRLWPALSNGLLLRVL